MNSILNKYFINYSYKNLYEYDRNIPDYYLNLFQNNKKINIDIFNKYNFNNFPQKKLVNKFNEFIHWPCYTSNYMKLITLDILINKSFSFKCLKTNKIFRSNKSFHYIFKNFINTKFEKFNKYGQGNRIISKTEKLINITNCEYDDLIIYIFDNIDDPFFIAIGNGSNQMVMHTEIHFIYYYKSNCLYLIKKNDIYNDIEITLENIINYNNFNEIKKSKKICNMYGYAINIAHSYWNEMSGFKFLIDMELLKYIDLFIVGPYDYFNIYSYLSKNNYNVIKEKNLTNINNILDNHSLLFKYNDWFMDNELKKFIFINNKIDDNESKYIKKIQDSFYPIITFNIRAINRYLYSQEDVITNIINNFLNIYPNMFIIFDGYIKDNNIEFDKYISQGFNFEQKDFDISYNKIINNIIIRINTKNYISLIGENLSKQINWLNISNYGFMQIGAGAHNYLWLVNKKCISLGRNEYINEELLLHTYHDYFFRVEKEFITYLNPIYINFEKTFNENNSFYIDWKIIFFHMYRDLLILEKNNFILLQYDNLMKYNIYQSWGLELSLEDLLNKNLLEACDSLKKYIISNL